MDREALYVFRTSQPPTMSPPDFAYMDREALYAFRKHAQNNNEESSSATDYFTVRYIEGKPRP